MGEVLVIVREPALPVDPRLPGEPTGLEVGRTRAWLGRRGVMVWPPTRLLALRIGGRGIGGRELPAYAAVLAGLWWSTGVLFSAVELPGRTAVPAIIFAVFQTMRWRRAQSRE